MNKKIIYLDNAATTQPLEIAVKTVARVMSEDYGNPSSLHRLGVRAQQTLQESRVKIAEFAGLSPEWLIFTSGATEANQTVLFGGARNPNKKRNHILMSLFEHPSVREAVPALKEKGYEIEWIIPDKDGMIFPRGVAKQIRPETELVSIIGVHNEIGVVQDITGIKRAIKARNPETRFHVDGVQWFAKFAMPAPSDMPDFFTWAAHKFHGPRGVGGIFKRPEIYLKPLITGGGQEKGIRSGTENVAAIAGAAAALEKFDRESTYRNILKFQEKIYRAVRAKEKLTWIGPPPGPQRSPYISFFSVRGKKSEIFIHELEESGIYISSGSACSGKSDKDHSFRENFPMDINLKDGLIRVSVGRLTTEEEIDRFCEELSERT